MLKDRYSAIYYVPSLGVCNVDIVKKYDPLGPVF